MPHRILIVDDDEPTRVGLAMLLEDAGYETITASTVPAAIKLLSEAHPDLLLVDIRLDEYNGLHLVAVRPEPIPAIVLTGFADPAIEADARRLGAEFLLKPISPSVLTSLVRRVLSEGRVGSGIRRWPRKPVMKEVRVDVDDAAARVLDVSYGGVCVEMRRSAGAGPPGAFRMFLPLADVPVPVEVVWSRRRDATTWLCGGMVAEAVAASWRIVVDTIA
ncbi:MAG TPA: response regulator [Vicinamibacterales bacterium]|nr:response regulator [Vicinamibacterales bacterium]